MTPPREDSVSPIQPAGAVSQGSTGDLESSSSMHKLTRAPGHSVKESSSAREIGGQIEGIPELQKAAGPGTSISIHTDEETGKLIVQVKDQWTGEVLRQLPPEEVLRMAKAIQRYLGVLVDKKS